MTEKPDHGSCDWRTRHPRKLEQIPETVPLIVTECDLLWDVPLVKRYQAVKGKVHARSATAVVRGYLQVIRAARGRELWTTEEAFQDFMQRQLKHRLRQRLLDVDRLQTLLQTREYPADVIPAAHLPPIKLK